MNVRRKRRRKKTGHITADSGTKKAKTRVFFILMQSGSVLNILFELWLQTTIAATTTTTTATIANDDFRSRYNMTASKCKIH